jgi:hypothetical protein
MEHVGQAEQAWEAGEQGETGQTGRSAEDRPFWTRTQYIELNIKQLGITTATYPRLEKLADGSTLMLYQDGRIGWNIYYVRSTDLEHWSPPQKLFASTKILNGQDDRCFSTADAVVLADGDLLAVASFRANKGYTSLYDQDGLMLRRSTDGGNTWSEEQVIYTGPNWEPYLLQLPSGEVQAYFTHIAPKMAMENTLHSSGVAIVRSFDNGLTWSPNVTESPYAADRVAQQYVKTTEEGVKSFTDQMPSAIVLKKGRSIALAMESQVADGNYKISLAYSGDNWAKTLGMNETGPDDRVSNEYAGAAPYLAQFPTGETVLGYNRGSQYRLRLGDADARHFGDEFTPFTGKGYWGTIEVIGPHTLVAAMANVVPIDKKRYNNSIMLAVLSLNRS